MKFFLLFFLSLTTLFAQDIALKKMIGSMIMVGFDGLHVEQNSTIVQAINQEHLGGVILFDKNYQNKKQAKNITSVKQLQTLTHQLQKLTNHFILIGVDQEGGKVARLKKAYGFSPAPSATQMNKLGIDKAKLLYDKQAQELQQEGINLNFAPVVDLCSNPKNFVIVKLQRCYAQQADRVTLFAQTMIEAQTHHHIFSVAKHFPGHGSSLEDSHQGFVDVSQTWSKEELLPYQNLIRKNKLPMIMTAHVFNHTLDSHYPATLSYKINTQLLREKMGFKGVIISDDMQMKAIAKNYTLQEAITLAINGGVDILLFGNQLATTNPKEVYDIIYKQVQKGVIPQQRIRASYQRIQKLIKSFESPLSHDKDVL